MIKTSRYRITHKLFAVLFPFLFMIPLQLRADSSQRRIASLGGEMTEIIHVLGLSDEIVAVDTTSTWPESLRSLPRVGYLRALSAEGVLSLSPNLVIANHEAGPPSVIQQLRDTGVEFHSLSKARNFRDVIANIKYLGDLLGTTEQANALASQLENRAQAFAERHDEITDKPGVLFLLNAGGGGPLASGTETAADAMINIVGGRNVITHYEGYKPIGAEIIVATRPDYILMTQRTLDGIGGVEKVVALPGISLTPAGKNRRIIAMDGMYLLGFGPRVVDAAEDLSAKIHGTRSPY